MKHSMHKMFDGHVTGALGGVLATITLTQYSDLMAAIAGTLTAAYMGVRLWSEIIKLRRNERDLRKEINASDAKH